MTLEIHSHLNMLNWHEGASIDSKLHKTVSANCKMITKYLEIGIYSLKVIPRLLILRTHEKGQM